MLVHRQFLLLVTTQGLGKESLLNIHIHSLHVVNRILAPKVSNGKNAPLLFAYHCLKQARDHSFQFSICSTNASDYQMSQWHPTTWAEILCLILAGCNFQQIIYSFFCLSLSSVKWCLIIGQSHWVLKIKS